jgi:hypothetical protein
VTAKVPILTQALAAPRTAVVTKPPAVGTFGNDANVDTKYLFAQTFGNDTSFFVRVRRRKLKGRNRRFHSKPLVSESASYDLVRAVRVDGKPRQKFILGLGSLKTPIPDGWSLAQFWRRALRKMRHRGLSEQQRRRVIAAMIRKGVPKLSKAQCKKFAAGSAGWVSPDDFADLFGAASPDIAEAAE